MSAPVPAPVAPPVVEVIARFRGRIVDIQHIRWTEPPAVAPAAWLVGGCSLLALGAVLFSLGQSQLAAACAAPPCPNAGGSGLGALLVALAVPPLALACVRWRDRPRTRYAIGESPTADLTVPLPAGARDDIPLVIALADNVVLGLPPGVRGALTGPGGLDLGEAAAQGRRSISLQEGASAHLELGELTFDIARVAAELPERARWQIDRLAGLTHAATALLIGGWFLSLEPGPPGDLEAIDVERFERVARYLTAVPSTTTPAPPPEVRPARVSPPARPRPRTVDPTPEPPGPPPPDALDPLAVPTRAEDTIATNNPLPSFVRRNKHSPTRVDSEFDYVRVAGFLNDEGFGAATDDFTIEMRVGQRSYADTEVDRQAWAEATSGPPRMAKHFGGLELAETERGGGVHDDRPKPTPKPSKMITLAATASRVPPPTAEEMKKIRRLVTLEIDPPTVTKESGVDSHAVHEYARKRSGDLRACYENQLDLDDTTNGVMQLQLRLDERGKVQRAWVDWGTLSIESINKCLVAALRRWQVEPYRPEPSRVVLHFDFAVRNR